jgi:2-polyprenyl-6-methoxyphenol hydroxylase-like FAD-dependent oxidoreductase
MLALALASRNLNNTLIDRKKKFYNIKNEKNKNIKSLSIFKKLKYLNNRF